MVSCASMSRDPFPDTMRWERHSGGATITPRNPDLSTAAWTSSPAFERQTEIQPCDCREAGEGA